MKDLKKNKILVVNGGSSSIKGALFEQGESLRRVLDLRIERIGQLGSRFVVKANHATESFTRTVKIADHEAAAGLLMEWLASRGPYAAVGHRVVHGGPRYREPQKITIGMIEELRRLSPFDPEHLPDEILLIDAFRGRFPELEQIACFDTALHYDMPRVAQLLPIPRRYEAAGVRRYGFHGLSYTYLVQELERVAGAKAATGRVILAHLGNGASL